jgi:hypothetical protein
MNRLIRLISNSFLRSLPITLSAMTFAGLLSGRFMAPASYTYRRYPLIRSFAKTKVSILYRQARTCPMLYRDFILGYFGKKIASAQKGYQKFVNALAFQQYDSPLEQVVSSTLLGSADFIALIYRQKIKGNRFAVRHWGLRSITVLQACSTKDRKR